MDSTPRAVAAQVVLDAVDVRALAEFYRALLGYAYRPGDEEPGDHDWLVLRPVGPGVPLAFQRVEALPDATWPDGPVPQQLHLDLTVPTAAALAAEHERVVGLGARVLRDCSDDPDEPLLVYADPAGHPFCVFSTQDDVSGR